MRLYLFMFVCVCTHAIFAQSSLIDGICGDSVSYRVENNTLFLNGHGATYEYLFQVNPLKKYKENIDSVIISDGITRLGGMLFSEFAKLKYIRIPETVKSIGDFAFDECKNLKSVIVPSSISSLGLGTFAQCESLKECKWLSMAPFGNQTFLLCKSLKNYIIPDGIKMIDCRCFAGCYSLKYIEIPEYVDSIAPYAFDGCYKLRDIIIRNKNIPSITDDSFFICYYLSDEKLKDLHVPRELKLYVPKESIALYKDKWGKYFDKIVPIKD